MPRPLTYIIYTPEFDENKGGVIFLHELAHTLNEMGERALLWPMKRLYKNSLRGRLRDTLRKSTPFALSPELNTPLAQPSDLGPASVVIYPELVPGNPLGAANVVRWLLYKPGELHPYDFGPDEMFFRVGEFCDIPEISGGAPDLLLWKINRAYRNEERPDRKGACYIVRKGKDKPRIPETEAPEAIQIDGMSHAEINDVFNRCDTFYSYDEATMYSQFAALCGCVSVVIPGMYDNRADWVADHEMARYGVAYGLDDLEHARATQAKVLPLLQREEAKGQETVARFITLTRARFGQS